MKKKLVILSFLLVPIASVIFHSCWNCDPQKSVSYSHKTLLVKNLDNSKEKTIETEAIQINKNAYGIRLYLTREKYVVACAKPVNSFFIQSTYAAVDPPDCPGYIFSSNDTIVSIKLFTLNKFDNQHSENSEITNYFKIGHSYSSIEDYVAKIRYIYEDYVDFEKSWGQELIIDLLLMTAPTTNNLHQFKIQVNLSDGRILEQLTTEIELL